MTFYAGIHPMLRWSLRFIDCGHATRLEMEQRRMENWERWTLTNLWGIILYIYMHCARRTGLWQSMCMLDGPLCPDFGNLLQDLRLSASLSVLVSAPVLFWGGCTGPWRIMYAMQKWGSRRPDVRRIAAAKGTRIRIVILHSLEHTGITQRSGIWTLSLAVVSECLCT